MEDYKEQQTVIPYLMLENAAAFIHFAKMVFDAEILYSRTSDDQQIILHAEIKIEYMVLMISEAKDRYGRASGNLFIYVSNADKTFNKAIYHGTAIIIEVADMN